MTHPLTLEEQAIAEWLEHGVEVEALQKKYQLPKLPTLIRDCFSRFVKAASDYHYDKTGELTHRSAAQTAGLELWMYELFMSKFAVDRAPGDEGKQKVEALKKHSLYAQ